MKTFGFISLGILIACALGALSGVLTRKTKDPVDLTPTAVVVAANDVTEGAAVTEGMTRQLTVAATYVTESMIRAADWPKVNGRKLTFPLQQGDVLTWQHFARVDRFRATEQCVLALHAGTEAAADERVNAELQSLVIPDLVASPPPPMPAGPTVRVVGAAKNLPEGTELSVASLRIIEVPAALFTDSLILEVDQGALVGAKVVSEVLEGDLLNWPLLRRDSVVGVNTCVARLNAVAHAARDEFAKTSAATFQPGEKP